LTQNNHIYKGKNLEDLKFALVKQDVYSNLYCSPPNSYGYDIISKTMKHQGPIALFTPIVNSSYIIVSTNKDDKETAIWKEKVHDCHHFQMEETLYETRYQFRSVVSSETVCRPSELAQDPEGIDWSQFDVVITMDNPVPARITQNYPQVIWAYFITEGCMSSAKKSMVEPITGYDLYLTQVLIYFIINLFSFFFECFSFFFTFDIIFLFLKLLILFLFFSFLSFFFHFS